MVTEENWEDLVPEPVSKVIDEIKGIDRIKAISHERGIRPPPLIENNIFLAGGFTTSQELFGSKNDIKEEGMPMTSGFINEPWYADLQKLNQ